MHRSNIIELIKAYNPRNYPEELVYKENILKFIEENTDCFERSLSIGHLTASCWLLDKTETKVLLMHHAKLGIWCQLGGHADGCQNLLAVAIKEAQEESGILGIKPVKEEIFDIDIHKIPGNAKEKEHYHYDVRFILKVVSDEEFISNRESKELRWIANKEELPSEERSMLRMFEKWQLYK